MLGRSSRRARSRLSLQVHDGLVWVPATPGLPRLPPIAGEEIRISVPDRKFNFDPVSRVFPMDEQLTAATCSSLLDYGPTGLRPEVAAAMPTVSHDGRTYTFRIRPGFRFSPPSNEPVTAETFRYTIERTLSPLAQNYPYYAPDIVGLEAYEDAVKAKRPAHIAGIRAHGMTLSITLAKPAGDFLARLAIPLFCPVPLSTPLDPARVTGPVASDGPYYFASVEGDRIVLLRNPNYARPPPAPGGADRDHGRHPDPEGGRARRQRASSTTSRTTSTARRRCSASRASSTRLYGPGSAAARAGRQRFFLHTQPMFDMVVFNTQRPLFRNLRLRQAVEYALDRPAMARAFWDAPASERIVQVPGYGPGHVYPLSRPDLRTARRLAGRKPTPGRAPDAVRLRALRRGCSPQVEPRRDRDRRANRPVRRLRPEGRPGRVPQGRHDHRHVASVQRVRARPGAVLHGPARARTLGNAAPAGAVERARLPEAARAAARAPRPGARRGLHSA